MLDRACAHGRPPRSEGRAQRPHPSRGVLPKPGPRSCGLHTLLPTLLTCEARSRGPGLSRAAPSWMDTRPQGMHFLSPFLSSWASRPRLGTQGQSQPRPGATQEADEDWFSWSFCPQGGSQAAGRSLGTTRDGPSRRRGVTEPRKAVCTAGPESALVAGTCRWGGPATSSRVCGQATQRPCLPSVPSLFPAPSLAWSPAREQEGGGSGLGSLASAALPLLDRTSWTDSPHVPATSTLNQLHHLSLGHQGCVG